MPLHQPEGHFRSVHILFPAVHQQSTFRRKDFGATLQQIIKPFKPYSMKRLLFTLEVLFMLSVLPFFLGMSMGRKYHSNNAAQEKNSLQGISASSEAYKAYPVALKNS